VFSKSLKSLCWQRRILMVDIDLMLVFKPRSDAGKMCLVTANVMGVHVGILK